MSDRTIPRSETTYLPSLGRSEAMSDDVANQSTAVADLTNEVERQRQIAEHERQQQEIRQTRQLEIVIQEAASELHPRTQSIEESVRNEATSAIAYVANLTDNAWNKLNQQTRKYNRWQRMMKEQDR